MKPHRVQQKRLKGWRKPRNTVCVSRPSKWGNPFSVVEYGQAKSVAMYRSYLLNGKGKKLPVQSLRGKNLACFCKLSEPCHADVLLEIANA